MTSTTERRTAEKPPSRAARRLAAGPPATARGPKSWVYALTTTNPPPGEPDGLTRWIVVTRAAVLSMTVFAGLVALCLAVNTRDFRWVDLLLAVTGIVLAHLNNNLTNDLFDTSVGTDEAGYPRALYAPHPLLSGLVTKRQLYAAVAVTTAADLVIGIVLLVLRGPVVAIFAVLGAGLSIAYTAPPLRLKKRGLGEPDVLLVWGPLMIGGTYFCATGHLPWQVILASLPYGLLCTTVLMGKHIDKIPYDAPTGTRTLPVIMGESRARTATIAMLIGFYVLIAVAVAAGALAWPTLLVALGIPRLLQVIKAFRSPRPEQPPAGFPVWPLWFAAVAFVHTRRAGSLLVVGLVIAAVFNVKTF